ncbi:MAG: molybdopterin-dependent oxidoreductase [Acidimicrobiia bacterium]
MKVTRRRFVQGSAAVGAAVAGRKFLFGDLDSIVSRTNTSRGGTVLPLVEDFIPTTCWVGKQDCGMIARRIDGRIVSFAGHPDNPRNNGTLCPKGHGQITAIYDPNRVKTPLIRTNEKGANGEWREASWDEALALTAEKVNEVRARNPKLVLWQKGRSKAKKFYDDAFVKSIGCSKLGHGAYCSDAGYRAMEYTTGVHGVQHPDMRSTNFLLAWGWNITNAGGNKFCWITWPQQLVAARERGMKVTHIDPRLRSAGPFADNWLPIKPGTDLALALALCRRLIEKGYIDVPYLSKYTNSPYLVGDDGLFLRLPGGVDEEGAEVGVEAVWDPATDGPVAAGSIEVPALEGTYQYEGASYTTAFDLFKAHVESATPEWAADITGLPAADIRKLAIDFGENAMIGSTTVVDGVEIPYRPVAIMAYHMAQQELGFQALRAMTMVAMMVGAVGAVGGLMTDFSWKIYKNYEAFGNLKVNDPPYDFTLKNSKYFPINTGHPGVVAKVMADPDRYGVDEIPEVAILHMVNPVASFPDRKVIMEGYDKFKFMTVISPWLSETADFYADVVLPAATIEKYEGPISASDGYTDATTLRIPPMDPMFESKGEIDIYMDLTEAIGTLYGEDGYLAQVNKALKLEGEFAIPTDTKPTVREIFDLWAKSQGVEGVSYFEENGVLVKGPIAASKRYGYAVDPPFAGAVHRLYGESLLVAQRAMRDKGAEEVYWQDYTALPTWRQLTFDKSPAEYDLTLISYHQIEHKQARTSFMPLLAELSPRSRVDINPTTAEARGIEEGDEVWVESQNAITGESRRIKSWAALTSSIRPDVVGMPHHFGMWTHPVNQANGGQGPSPNEIFYTGEGYTVQTADQTFHVKVRVYPAGEEA